MNHPAVTMPESEPIARSALDRVGIEIELVAPPGGSREALARRLALQIAGSVRPRFHHDTELTMVKDRPVFHHLSLGFDVFDADGTFRCRLVDDITILDDLDARLPPTSGLYRILSDERRILNLVEQVADPAAPAATVLDPVAALFGSEAEEQGAGVIRLNDVYGQSVAAVALQGGERERVCEVIMPPLRTDQRQRLAEVLDVARSMGFRVPAEAAVHVHFDAEPFRSASALVHLVTAFSADRDQLMADLETNRRCRRIAPLPPALIQGVSDDGFAGLAWDEVQAWLRTLDVPKHADVNLRALAGHRSAVDTVEVRILPGSIDPDRIMTKIEQLRGLLARTD